MSHLFQKPATRVAVRVLELGASWIGVRQL